MKTVFMTIYDGMVSKNILRSNVFKILESRDNLEIVLIVDPSKREMYEKEFGGPNVRVEAPVEFEYKGYTAFERLWARFFAQIPRTKSVRLYIKSRPFSQKKNFWRMNLMLFLQLIFDHKFCRIILRKIDEIIFTGSQFSGLFEKYKPALVFAPNVYAPCDVWVLKQAKRRKIPNVGMIKSWDNLTTKGLFRTHPERLIVHNHNLKEEAIRLDDYPADKIFVPGMPHYDVFFNQPNLYTRASFWEKYGFDPNKKIILYLEPGSSTAPNGGDVWLILDEFLREKKIHFPAEIFISIHPAFPAKEDILKKLEKIKFIRLGDFAGINYKSWELSNRDMLELMYAVKFSDLCITTGSTMNIEAAILDKPIINIAFDGFAGKNYYKSIRQYYDYEHLARIIKSGGVKVAYNQEQLLRQINELLTDPSIGKEGRKKIVGEQCAFTDGKSGQRLGVYLLSFLAE